MESLMLTTQELLQQHSDHFQSVLDCTEHPDTRTTVLLSGTYAWDITPICRSGRARMHLVPGLFAVFQCHQNHFCSRFSATPVNRLFLVPHVWMCYEIGPELRNSHYMWIVRDS